MPGRLRVMGHDFKLRVMAGLRVMALGDGLWIMDYGLQRVTGDGYASRESRLWPLVVTDTVYVCKSMCKVV